MAVKQRRLGPGTLTIGGSPASTSFESQVLACTLDPKVSTKDPREVLSGETIAGARTESWTLKGKLVDDFGETGSIVEWCFTNRGKQLPFAFVPAKAGRSTISGEVVVEAVAIGGDVGQVNDTDFEFVALMPKLGSQTPAT